MSESKSEAILKAGSDIAGPAAAAALGLVLGGDVGAVAGAAGAVPAASTLRLALREFSARVLGRREEARVGAVLLSAGEEVRQLLAAGRAPRDDGFFQSDEQHSDASEIAEAALLAAQRDAQDAKAPLMGKLLARVGFDSRVSKEYAHLLVREAEALTYRQICCLALFNFEVRERYGLSRTPLLDKGGTDPLHARIGVLQEILDLYRRTMVQQRAEDHPGTDILLDTSTIKPAFLEVTGLGGWLTVLMSLPSSVPAGQLESTACLLRADPPVMAGQAVAS